MLTSYVDTWPKSLQNDTVNFQSALVFSVVLVGGGVFLGSVLPPRVDLWQLW